MKEGLLKEAREYTWFIEKTLQPDHEVVIEKYERMNITHGSPQTSLIKVKVQTE